MTATTGRHGANATRALILSSVVVLAVLLGRCTAPTAIAGGSGEHAHIALLAERRWPGIGHTLSLCARAHAPSDVEQRLELPCSFGFLDDPPAEFAYGAIRDVDAVRILLKHAGGCGARMPRRVVLAAQPVILEFATPTAHQ